ncbi:MAG: hypothetical protein IPK16_10315 [Anaerolineales bacterium]|nr:hypothetical protein [Anaerolineales bacterium]
MNAISAFFVRNIVAVYFFYGLAFFTMGIALLLASRRSSQFRFAAAILPLALFGFVHAANEFYEMFQKIGWQTSARMPSMAEELVRLGLLVASFLLLLLFGLVLLSPNQERRSRIWGPLVSVLALWSIGVVLVIWRWQPAPMEAIAMADDLARYGIAIPAAIIGAWALMAQQRTFREQNMSRFGRDLVWAAAALVLYGVIGQVFVAKTLLIPSQILNNANFLTWFGIPVQLFRALMAAALTFFIIRALQAFDLEGRRRLETANEARLQAQAQTLASERRTSQQMERLNEELRLSTHKLSLLLDLSNLLATPLPLAAQLHAALQRIVESLTFSEAGLISLSAQDSDYTRVMAATGFMVVEAAQEAISGRRSIALCRLPQASALGSQSYRVVCRCVSISMAASLSLSPTCRPNATSANNIRARRA